MRLIITIVFILSIIQTSFAQEYKSEEIIDRASGLLKTKVGENVFKYYRFELESYYKYCISGKTNWAKLKPKRKLKGKFLEAQICFSFQHPLYKYDLVNKSTYIILDSLLNLTNEPFVGFIPEFIMKNEPSNWLSNSEIEKIIKQQNIKVTEYSIVKRLEYDNNRKKNIWVVLNTLSEGDGFSEVEILKIDPVTGDVLEHKQEEQFEYR